MKTYKQWQIPNGSLVKLPDGTFATFLKMDGMYAQWQELNGLTWIGNFDKFKKEKKHFTVI